MKFLSKLFTANESVINKSNVLVLIDLREHTRGGHFGPWLKWFAMEFALRFDRVVIVTPTPDLTQTLFQENQISSSGSLSFYKLPKRFNRVFALEYLAKKLVSSGEQASFFVMWGHDLVKLKQAKHKLPWATFFGISVMLRQPQNENSQLERDTLQLVEKEKSCKGFFYLDNYLSNVSAKAICLSDIENVEILESKSQLVEQIKLFARERLTIGCFGLLTGSRCLNAVLQLARNQYDVNFVLVGKIKKRTVHEDLQKYLTPGVYENLFIHPSFVDDESELNSTIQAVDGVFIDGSNYPQHSGIACKALHFGKCIISPSGSSWTNDLIKKANVGVIYDSPNCGLKNQFDEWKKLGGPENSKAQSDKIRLRFAVKESFDRITERLVQSSHQLSTKSVD